MYANIRDRTSRFSLPILLLTLACGGTEAAPEGAPPPAPDAQATAPASAPDQIDACALLSKADVEAAVGRPVQDPVGDSIANLFGCRYRDPQDPSGTENMVRVAVLVADNAADARDVQETSRSNAAEVNPVAGLGDDAYWDAINRSLNVVKGAYHVTLSVSHDAGGLDSARKLAEQLLPRLP
jgi:hypothetical protein